MQALQLPRFNYKTTARKGKSYIFDPVRKKYVSLTPEEWVRQHMINYLIQYLGYPRTVMNVECKAGKSPNARNWQRADILIYKPFPSLAMIVECKAPHQAINHAALYQMMRYNTQRIPCIMFTNGKQHFCFYLNKQRTSYTLLAEIPPFSSLGNHLMQSSCSSNHTTH